MAYFQDLTPYAYYVDPPGVASLNVGWLSQSMPFSQGETSQAFKDRLFQFCLDEYVVHIARGFHVCELCSKVSEEQWYAESQGRYGEKTQWLNIGDGEIRVIGKSAIYAAPTLIYHYVVEHQYKPPDAFIEAVLTGPAPESEAFQALLEKFDYRKSASIKPLR